MDGTPVRAGTGAALRGMGGLDVEGRVHGRALVVGVRVGVDAEVRLAFGLELLAQLADQLVLALVLVLQVEDVRLERDLLVPDAAVVVPKVCRLPILSLKVVDEGAALAQHRFHSALDCLLRGDLLRVVRRLCCWVILPLPGFRIPVVPFVLPLWRVEIGNNIGLLRDEVQLIPLQLLNHAVTDDQILLPRPALPSLHSQVQPLRQFLRLGLVEQRHGPEAKRSAPHRPSNHDYNRWRTSKRGSTGRSGASGTSSERKSRSARR